MSHKHDGYWPGFVDALVNVVIAMVFMVVLLSICSSMFGQLITQAAAARMAAQQLAAREEAARAATAAEKPAQGEGVARQADDGPGGMQPAAPVHIVVHGDGGSVHSGRGGAGQGNGAAAAVRIVGRGNGIELAFREDVYEPDAGARDAIARALDPLAPAMQRGVLLRVFVAVNASSEARRNAFLRILSARNLLTDRGVPPDRITMKVEDNDGQADPARIQILVREGGAGAR